MLSKQHIPDCSFSPGNRRKRILPDDVCILYSHRCSSFHCIIKLLILQDRSILDIWQQHQSYKHSHTQDSQYSFSCPHSPTICSVKTGIRLTYTILSLKYNFTMWSSHERDQLIELFLEKNAQINLSALKSHEDVYIKHILDSVSLLDYMLIPDGSKLIDIWTGGWFPLLPLASKLPRVSFTGLDARRKKIDAVQDIAHSLWLSNVHLIRSRIEEHPKKYDYVIARAVAYADILFDRSRHVCKPWGTVIWYKLRTTEEDADIRELCHLHKRTCEMFTYTLPNIAQKRCIYVLRQK